MIQHHVMHRACCDLSLPVVMNRLLKKTIEQEDAWWKGYYTAREEESRRRFRDHLQALSDNGVDVVKPLHISESQMAAETCRSVLDYVKRVLRRVAGWFYPTDLENRVERKETGDGYPQSEEKERGTVKTTG